MGIKDWFLNQLLKIPNFHPEGIKYLELADRINLKAEIKIPKELLPGASLLVAKAWANTSVFENAQHLPKPFWAEKQMSPDSEFFEAIGHRLLSMNVTLRNWTMVSIPSYETEAIVDTIGALVPVREMFSLEVWAIKEENDKIIFFRPHVHGNFFQTRDKENYPAIRNIWSFEGGTISWEIYTEGDSLGQWACIDVYPELEEENDYKIVLALRPYNYDGITFVNKIKVVGRNVYLNPESRIFLTTDYDYYLLGEYPFDDPADPYEKPLKLTENYEYNSEIGLATALFVFSGGAIGARIFMEGNINAEPPNNTFDEYWKETLPTLPIIHIANSDINKVFKATAVDLLMIWDGTSITPGPANYHHFWIRDNAYILPALLQLGRYQEVEAILRTYPKRQTRNGYFVSQKGEWDANGQAIYTISKYYKHSKDNDFLDQIINSVWKATKWIEDKRNNWIPISEEYVGLLPPGFSAEHFGGTDSYYWDQFWSLRGILEASYLLEKAGEHEKAELAKEWYQNYRNDIIHSLKIVEKKLEDKAIPTSPRRKYDSAMIGSVSSLYPLRIFPEKDERITRTLEKIKEVSWYDDLFFQRNGHMALGTYLSLHVAHSHLWRGERSVSIKIWNKLLSYGTPTFTWPEGINPRTKFGGMGDGHHMWAASDVNMFIRDMLVFEKEKIWYLFYGIDIKKHKKIVCERLPLESSIIRRLELDKNTLHIIATKMPRLLKVMKSEKEIIEIIPEHEKEIRIKI